jgi:hypothetical protein
MERPPDRRPKFDAAARRRLAVLTDFRGDIEPETEPVAAWATGAAEEALEQPLHRILGNLAPPFATVSVNDVPAVLAVKLALRARRG